MKRKTALYDKHMAFGAKMMDFASFLMPLQYTTIIKEHQAVRDSVGVFDLSHMGEILVSGSGAEKFLNYVTSNDLTKLEQGRIQYTLLLNEKGGVIDDILIYRVPEGYYLVVNAANKAKDYRWLTSHQTEDVKITDLSDTTALIAIQGPNALKVTAKVLDYDLEQLKYYRYLDLSYQNEIIRVSRTGYTGEDGFEIYLSPELAPSFWDAVFAAGEPWGILPVGLGARDTLRLEARMPLYGNELTEEISPLAAGLDRFIAIEKKDFIGKTAYLKAKETGLTHKLVGFILKDKGIARHGYEIVNDGENIGYVTSGSVSPSTGESIGLGYVLPEFSQPGSIITIKIRKQEIAAKVVQGRFIKTRK